MNREARDSIRVVRGFGVIALALLCALLAAAIPHAQAAGPALPSNPVASVWVAGDHSLSRIDPATNQVVERLDLGYPAQALAVNARDSTLWVLSPGSLQKLDSDGTPLVTLDRHKLGLQFDDPRLLTLDPYDGSLWVGAEQSLLHISAAGQTLLNWRAPDELRAVALDLDESVWLLTARALLHLSVDGKELAHTELGAEVDGPRRFALDSLGGVLWVAGGNTLWQYNLNDLAAAPQAVTLPTPPMDRTRSNDEKTLPDGPWIRALAVHPAFGTLWLIRRNQLLLYNRDGALLQAVDLHPYGLDEAERIAFEPVSLSLWLENKRTVARFTGGGQFVAAIPLDTDIDALGVSPFHLLPALTLLAPPDDSLTNYPVPPIRYGLGARCNDIPCNLADAYTRALSLRIDLDSLDLGKLFTTANGEADYIPPMRLSEGLHALNAEATDVFGHSSEPITSHFTIDTIPPTFLNVTPSDGAVVTTAAITIEGVLDDPTATTLLLDGAGSAVSTASGAGFRFAVTLLPGLNAFTLIARDPAGNESQFPLHLIYQTANAVSVKITSPAPGTRLAGLATVVSGTYQGPVNTGIAVNGVAAFIAGNQFIVNLALTPGPNTLTATATTPDGATATDAVAVTAPAVGTQTFNVSVDPAGGIAPLAVSFTVAPSLGQAIQRVDADFYGRGNTDYSTTDVSTPMQNTYADPGVYTAKFTVTDANGNTSSQTVAIVVYDAAQMDDFFTQLWNGMNTALIKRDITGASAYLNTAARQKYLPVFQALLPQMPDIIASYSPLARLSISEDIGEYAIERPYNGDLRVYLIYFLKDADGVWRLDSL
ncbi:MAG: hypothetical protein ACYDDO_14745 [Acidiferrobacterales bacterium]